MLGANFNWCWISTVRCYVARLSGARCLMLGANFNRCWISTVRCQVYNIHRFIGAVQSLLVIMGREWVLWSQTVNKFIHISCVIHYECVKWWHSANECALCNMPLHLAVLHLRLTSLLHLKMKTMLCVANCKCCTKLNLERALGP